MTISADARETRSAMRAAFTLIRLGNKNSEVLLDALEAALESYVDKTEQFATIFGALLQDDTVRVEVLRRAATLMGRGEEVGQPTHLGQPRPVSAEEVRNMPYDRAKVYMAQNHAPIASRSVDSERWERRHMRIVKDVYDGEGMA